MALVVYSQGELPLDLVRIVCYTVAVVGRASGGMSLLNNLKLFKLLGRFKTGGKHGIGNLWVRVTATLGDLPGN